MRHLTGILISLAVASALVPSWAQEPAAARMIVLASGNDMASNDILYQYMDTVDLGALEALAAAHGEVIPFQDLIPHLPDALPGWSAGDPDGMMMSMGEVSYSLATRDYEKDGAEDDVEVIIWDTLNQQMGPWYVFWYGAYSFETSEGYARTTTYKGRPAWEQRDYSDNSGTLVVGLDFAQPVPEAAVASFAGILVGGAAIPLRRKFAR
jgi:hypothetical protein